MSTKSIIQSCSFDRVQASHDRNQFYRFREKSCITLTTIAYLTTLFEILGYNEYDFESNLKQIPFTLKWLRYFHSRWCSRDGTTLRNGRNLPWNTAFPKKTYKFYSRGMHGLYCFIFASCELLKLRIWQMCLLCNHPLYKGPSHLRCSKEYL